MLLFVSGRCDIPAFYSEWLFQRFKAGFVDVRNPFNPHQISRIALTQEKSFAHIASLIRNSFSLSLSCDIYSLSSGYRVPCLR